MANIIRLCSGLDNLTAKSLIKWKFCWKSHEIHAVKCRFNNRWRQFTTRKVISNAKEPLSLCTKIGIGIACIAVKAAGCNTVFCLDKTETKNRLDYNSESTLKTDPNFNWKKFFQLLGPYWAELVGIVLAALICALLSIQIPVSLGKIVDILTKVSPSRGTMFGDLKKPALKIITFYSLQSLFTFVYISLLAHVGEGLAKTLKVNLFSSILDQDITFFDRNRTGEILTRNNIMELEPTGEVSNYSPDLIKTCFHLLKIKESWGNHLSVRLTVDIQDFKSSFKTIVSQGLRNVTQIIGCSISLFYISPSMTGIMMITIPTVILIGTFLGSYLRKISYNAKAQSAKVTLTAEEAISNIRTVRSFSMEDQEKKILDGEAELCKILNVKLGYGIALFQAGTNLFLNGMVLGTIYLGGYMMSTGNLSAGDLMAFLVAVQILQRSFSQISLLFGLYIKGKHAGARVFEIMDLPFGKTLQEGKIIPYHSLIPTVEYKDIVFAYPTRPETTVIKNVNITIPAGKTVALVGSSGSGKSTLAWLLERFYDVEHGSIIVGGENVKDLNSKWLRKNVIGFISQEPVLFATTVMENIRYGKPNATDEEVIEAAKLANADEFIREFPDGYKTLVGERGITISGGQKQRIAIARALIKNPAILILDEATSALDSDAEKAVQVALEKVIKSRTTIIIAHRLCTIKNADLIVVLHNGVVVETGTHKELLEKRGMYAALVAQQLDAKRG